MTAAFEDVQRIVLHGSTWEAAQHLVLNFPERCSAPHFLKRLEKAGLSPTPARFSAASQKRPDRQVSLGFSRRGLEHARVPSHVLSLFALKSPAFYAGAAVRAASQLGATAGLPREWKKPYEFATLDAVITVHGKDTDEVADAMREVDRIACDAGVHTQDLQRARRLPTPQGEVNVKDAMWTHFGFRDGLSRIGITGWTLEADMQKCNEGSRHSAGEFLLGHPQNSGANPWIAGADGRVWPERIRSFFHNGSFGVLHQIKQHVDVFDKFVASCKKGYGLEPDRVKAKLCGRYTDGRPMAADQGKPEDDFEYTADPKGELCPFGSHVRRMNPRGADLAHSVRRRPLLRRGLPYGSAAPDERGLMGQFFCASIEDQFEHLVGQWADRVPLGNADAGGARDPMFGAQAAGDGAFVIACKDGKPIEIRGMPAFATTVGLAYLFYPSLTTLASIRDTSLWRLEKLDEDEK